MVLPGEKQRETGTVLGEGVGKAGQGGEGNRTLALVPPAVHRHTGPLIRDTEVRLWLHLQSTDAPMLQGSIDMEADRPDVHVDVDGAIRTEFESTSDSIHLLGSSRSTSTLSVPCSTLYARCSMCTVHRVGHHPLLLPCLVSSSSCQMSTPTLEYRDAVRW